VHVVSSALKAVLTWHCMRTLQECREACGGQAKKRNKPIKGLGLEHLNKPAPVIPSQLTSSTLRTTQFQADIFC
nr:acyl-coenzyme A oxidase 3, peroxisomal-like [Tanacetum cinerariifolium]